MLLHVANSLRIIRRWPKLRAAQLAKRLNVPDQYAEMLTMAARLHDEGKRATRWQRAFNAPE